jgi:UDP-2-acetamido-3-amino-2,3-dideoxy-glucuronate N-acetyltransferase
MKQRVHPSAVVEAGVIIGEDTSVWDNAHIRTGARIGSGCIVGDKAYIGPGVVVGDLVKLNTSVYLCTGVTIERGVMVSAHVVFTNDTYPRATDPDLARLRSSEPNDDTKTTVVREGATIGAAAVIGPGVEVGRFAMVGMGSVVTRSVAAFHLVVGNPARTIGFVCRCGHRLRPPGSPTAASHTTCSVCDRTFAIGGDGEVAEILEG